MKSSFRAVTLFSFAFVGLTTAPALLAQGSSNSNYKGSSDLPSSNSMTPVDVIIQFTASPSTGQMNNISPFGQIQHQFTHINAIHATIPAAFIPFIEALPFVKYVSFNRVNSRMVDLTTASVNASAAWSSGYNGSGIGVAVIDSGVYQHPDLSASNHAGSRVVYSQSFLTGLDASDQYGHGTHVAGIVAGNGTDSTGPQFSTTYTGVAPNANIINLRVLDENGNGTDAGVIAAIDEAIQLKNVYNIRVINLSLGRPVYESYTLDPLCQAVEAAYQAGIVVVAAAGNYGRDNSVNENGYGTIVAPGNDPFVITVGAMNMMGTPYISDDIIASYSSKGPTAFDHLVKPDLVAPGNGVISLLTPNSTLATQYPTVLIPASQYQPGATGMSSVYMQLSGTSMATPVVSGTVALMLQENPSLTPDQVKARLMKTAVKSFSLYSTAYDLLTGIAFQDQSDIFTIGAGYLNVQSAMANTDLATLPAMSPTADFVSSFDVTMNRNFSLVWGSSVVWGDAAVYGTQVFLTVLNGSSIVWGDSVVWGDAVITGNSIVWGDSVLLGTSIQALDVGDGDSSQ